jgi:hypothetical protein
MISDEILFGYDWRSRHAATGPKAHWNAISGTVGFLRARPRQATRSKRANPTCRSTSAVPPPNSPGWTRSGQLPFRLPWAVPASRTTWS